MSGNVDNGSKKAKGFNAQQEEALQGVILSALQEERKSLMEIMEEKNKEFESKLDQVYSLLSELKESLKSKEYKSSNMFQTPTSSSTKERCNDSSTVSFADSTLPNSATPSIAPTSKDGNSKLDIHEESISNDTVSRSSSHGVEPIAPVDSQPKFPRIKELQLMNVKPDEFVLWSKQLIAGLKGLTKYEGILDRPPDKSWELFKLRNKKYSPHQLEQHYLDAHKVTWSYVTRAIPAVLVDRIDEEMKANVDQYNLPILLSFLQQDPSFYEDAYSLFSKITDHYVMKSSFRYDEIQTDLLLLRYSGDEDPKLFISKYHKIISQARLLIPEYVEQQDHIKAMDLLARLPKTDEFEMMKNQFLKRDKDNPISTKEVEETLRHWWIKKGVRKKYSKSDHQGRDRKPNINAATYPSSNKKDYDHRSRSRSRSRSKDRSRSHSSSRSNIPDHQPYSESSDSGDDLNYNFGCFFVENDNHNNYDEDFVGNVMNRNYRYIPNANEAIMDGGSVVMISPRDDLLSKRKDIYPVKIGTIAGERITKQEGVLKLSSRATALHVKYLPNIPFTILSVGQICAGDQCIVVHTNKAAYTVPKNILPEKLLEEKSVLTCPKKGNLYVTLLPGTKTNDNMKYFQVGGNTDKSSIKPHITIPKKEENTYSASQPARKELNDAGVRRDKITEKDNGNGQKKDTSNHASSSSSINATILSNPITTRSKTRTSSPHPLNVKIKEEDNSNISHSPMSVEESIDPEDGDEDSHTQYSNNNNKWSEF